MGNLKLRNYVSIRCLPDFLDAYVIHEHLDGKPHGGWGHPRVTADGEVQQDEHAPSVRLAGAENPGGRWAEYIVHRKVGSAVPGENEPPSVRVELVAVPVCVASNVPRDVVGPGAIWGMHPRLDHGMTKVLDNVDLAAFRPPDRGDVPAEKPEGRPEARL